ncbi:MAG: hypothetical protein IPP14_04855 [Planctomycetes bacterium]|nr:hypothetical protein [Planctomycetota bacterium]
MRPTRPFLLALLLLVALAGVWWLLQDSTRTPAPRNDAPLALENAPTQRPGTQGHAAPVRPDRAAPETVQTPVASETPPAAPELQEPALHVPDYGPLLYRSGARAEFELADARGNPLGQVGLSVALWRQQGSFWLRDEATVTGARDRVICTGLGQEGLPGTGLEPGNYVLELESNQCGRLRHAFTVGRGEVLNQRIQMPNWSRVVCFRFVQADGSAVSHLRAGPSLVTQTTALNAVERPSPEVSFLRRPPASAALGGGGGWARYSRRSSSSGPLRKQWVPTDEGRYFVPVWAGAQNTVTFVLGDAWGQAEYKVTDEFVANQWDNFEVKLQTAPDFAEQLKQAGSLQVPPGNVRVLDAQNYRPEVYDPMTAPMQELAGRLVLKLDCNFEPIVQASFDGKTPARVFEHLGDLWYFNYGSAMPVWWRVSDGDFYESPWELIVHQEGAPQVQQRSFQATLVPITAEGLSPTLRAFAHTLDFDLAFTVKGEPGYLKPAKDEETIVEDGDTIVEDPQVDPTEVPTDDPRRQAPRDGTMLQKLIPVQQQGRLEGTLRLGGERSALPVAGSLATRVHLRGAARFQRESSGSYFAMAGRPQPFTPVTLNGNWKREAGEGPVDQLLRSGTVQPHIDRAFCLRAVGDDGEGLPWVVGLVQPLEVDDLAQRTRQSLLRSPVEVQTEMQERAAYEKALDEADEEKLKALIGKTAYEAFEDDDQRRWFARQGTWHADGQPLYSDDHGYIVTAGQGLEPGKIYVLYLWGQSRNDLQPDARIVFKAADVTDLGVIRLPSFR